VKLLVDTNVVLDVVLAREPWAEPAATLLSAIEEGRAAGYIAGHAVTTVHYIVARAAGRGAAADAVADLLHVLSVVPIGADDFRDALTIATPDYEDAVQVIAALRIGADYIATRDARDFRRARVPARSPSQLLPLLAARPG